MTRRQARYLQAILWLLPVGIFWFMAAREIGDRSWWAVIDVVIAVASTAYAIMQFDVARRTPPAKGSLDRMRLYASILFMGVALAFVSAWVAVEFDLFT